MPPLKATCICFNVAIFATTPRGPSAGANWQARSCNAAVASWISLGSPGVMHSVVAAVAICHNHSSNNEQLLRRQTTKTCRNLVIQVSDSCILARVGLQMPAIVVPGLDVFHACTGWLIRCHYSVI